MKEGRERKKRANEGKQERRNKLMKAGRKEELKADKIEEMIWLSHEIRNQISFHHIF